jgi:uncharacterized protein
MIEGVEAIDQLVRGLSLEPGWIIPFKIALWIGLIAMIISLFRNGYKGWAWALIIALVTLFIFTAKRGLSGGGRSGGGGSTGSW